MPHHTRYAIYFAPEARSPLAEFGAAWLGWDIETGEERAHPPIKELPVSVSQITSTPRKYGFHGTLKPPFRLAQGATQEGLVAEVKDFAARHQAFEMPPLRLASLGKFLALTLSSPSQDLRDLAFACVAHFDGFRAPLTDVELVKRRATGLSPRQEVLLCDWGYPYVDDEFRFHLTLSGALGPELLAEVLASLDPVLAPLCREPVAVREVCLCGEATDGRFHIVRRFPLRG